MLDTLILVAASELFNWQAGGTRSGSVDKSGFKQCEQVDGR